ncbi:ABC transporter permease [Paralcaligenes ureilyticus]|uniref:Peptide/nickel transport system permease protein n=1 Tax=Paralcaligenes ureilyticus TaxID=627131 RepID=A0A4R3LR83_9BURK|nr:ABC transporter permease [Paralcaligenes ureilyticus]TCT03084.1 peptide/nickel transport system permease protein [Paralcaligenes ureilyticus]
MILKPLETPAVPPAGGRALRWVAVLRRELANNLRIIRADRLGSFGAVVIVVAALVAVFGPWLMPHDPYESLRMVDGRMAVLHPPSFEFPLGTTNLARDLLSQMIVATRTTMIIGLFSGLISIVIGANIGLFAGYYGGRVDNVLMRLTDIVYGMPFLPFIIVLISLFGRSIGFVMLAIVVIVWRTSARVVRAQTMAIKQRQYVAFAKARGASDMRIIYRHIVPNILPLLLLYTSFNIAWAIVTEASASFLGFGDPNAITWGSILQDLWASGYTRSAWWWFIAPSAAIVLLVSAFVFVSRAYEVVANPRLGDR